MSFTNFENSQPFSVQILYLPHSLLSVLLELLTIKMWEI